MGAKLAGRIEPLIFAVLLSCLINLKFPLLFP